MNRICVVFCLLTALLLSVPSAAVEVLFVHNAPGAGEVYVAGSFNGWKAYDLAMTKKGPFWAVAVDLEPGTHQYKFVVDGAWTQDAANPNGIEDGYGGLNSVVTVPASAEVPIAANGEAMIELDDIPSASVPTIVSGSGTMFSCSAPGAGSVHVAGEFNDWNPTADAMSDPDGDGVFSVTLPLAQGSYQYKFVVDGNWQEDPNAADSADDGFGGKNSVIVVAEGAAPAGAAAGAAAVSTADGVLFSYDAGGAVGSCFVAGDFNSWNPTCTSMTDDAGDGVYTCSLPLDSGTYMYKFVVDGNWLQDPANPDSADDGFGGKNSLLTVGEGAPGIAAPATPAPAAGGGDVQVTFSFTPVISGVSNVSVAGSFNGWDPNANPLTDDDEDGTYTGVVNLSRGEHTYKFVVDGEWHQDSNNPNTVDDGFGGANSVVHVRAGDTALDAAGTAAPGGAAVGMRTVPFTVKAGKNANVFLAGTFNDWNDSKTRMSDADGDGVYEIVLLLEPGSYQYKFVVDGNWQADANNPDGTEDGFGGQNSLLEVDDRFASVAIERGDGRVFTDDLEPIFDYSSCNPLTAKEISIAARAHLNDVDKVQLSYSIDGGTWTTEDMRPSESDPAFRTYRATVHLPGADSALEYAYHYVDGEVTVAMGRDGVGTPDAVKPFRYTREILPPFTTPDWAKDGVIYQIFPERFRNGNPDNDPDFSEPWYQGANKLPSSGKTNGEYFHMVDDWTDVSGLSKSPYRTDGKPDYFSFYGGDIAGVHEKLDYLNDLGVTVIYFNPLNQGMSNHKYDPTDYNTVDPHFASEDEFKDFVKDAHDHGIRIVVDMAFNHTGNWHFAFRDAFEKGSESEYWSWYEWKRWPMPEGRDVDGADYYDCWWGFGLHPNLNWDLERPNNAENNIASMADAEPNMAVVDHVLGVARHWLGELDIDGFRLDVPNEVPFWFWDEFNRVCNEVKPDCWLVGEIWGNAGSWIGPDGFDSTMNYKYFRDPVMEFFGQGRIDASTFEKRLAPGRSVYPPQSVQVMMNLIDSHDTIRYLTTTKDVKRLMLAALFEMSYVGMPHIWYGDEVGMEGGKDPDCRRPMDWNYVNDPRKVALRDFYGTITRFRRDNQVLSRGDVLTVQAQGKALAMARRLDTKCALSLFNAGPQPVTFTLGADDIAAMLPAGGSSVFKVIAGTEWFPNADRGQLISGTTLELGEGDVTFTLPGMSGAMLVN